MELIRNVPGQDIPGN
ncbi:Protein of unknown function [Pyronema omphalodes CBS 100304]|uniref:Uncharacterized protein n=1 Tax=Pyronema omphalodes (strain CBS 100304) TaxID=1076935 RepID=U4LFC3_PYROM|nr:Protein of unknown function [Pyronema omphalodes CBS 100304]